MKLFLILSLMVLTSSCATKKFKSFNSHDEFAATANKLVGKTPKEVVAILGQPMRAFFNDGVDQYYSIVYPVGNGDLSLTEVMFNADLICYSMTFEKVNNYIYKAWYTGNPSASCRSSKDEKINTSLID
jgi:hypothetical protein